MRGTRPGGARPGCGGTGGGPARAADEARGAGEARVRAFIDGLVSHYVLDGGRLVVCHAGL
ncbi:hypothetical protein, partial [Streptomyces zhihengii]